jgi:hypothetical protein
LSPLKFFFNTQDKVNSNLLPQVGGGQILVIAGRLTSNLNLRVLIQYQKGFID